MSVASSHSAQTSVETRGRFEATVSFGFYRRRCSVFAKTSCSLSPLYTFEFRSDRSTRSVGAPRHRNSYVKRLKSRLVRPTVPTLLRLLSAAKLALSGLIPPSSLQNACDGSAAAKSPHSAVVSQQATPAPRSALPDVRAPETRRARQVRLCPLWRAMPRGWPSRTKSRKVNSSASIGTLASLFRESNPEKGLQSSGPCNSGVERKPVPPACPGMHSWLACALLPSRALFCVSATIEKGER